MYCTFSIYKDTSPLTTIVLQPLLQLFVFMQCIGIWNLEEKGRNQPTNQHTARATPRRQQWSVKYQPLPLPHWTSVPILQLSLPFTSPLGAEEKAQQQQQQQVRYYCTVVGRSQAFKISWTNDFDHSPTLSREHMTQFSNSFECV